MSSKDLTASSGNYERRVRFNFSFSEKNAVLSAAAVYVSPRPPSSVRRDSHHDGATAAAFQGSWYYLCGSHEGCMCVCVSVRVCLPVCHPEQNLDDCNQHLPLIFKSTTGAVQTSQQRTVQQAANLLQAHINIMCMEQHIFSPFSTCDTPGISSQPHPEEAYK